MWCLIPFTSSQELEVVLSQTKSSDTERLELSKLKHIPERYCLIGSLTEAYLDSLSGMMLKPFHSKMKLHEAMLNGSEKGAGNSSFVAGSRSSLARILVSLENRPDLEKALAAGFTAKSCESLAWYDRDTSSWKTYQRSFLTGWETYSETWPRWGMMQDGSAFAHPMSALRMGAIDGSASQNWATPNTMDSLPAKSAEALEREAMITRSGRSKPSNLRGQVSNKQNWPTPNCADAYTDKLKSSQQKPGSMHSVNLSQAAKMWPTPTCNMVSGGANHNSPQVLAGKHGINLSGAVARKEWPTPSAHNAKETGAPSQINNRNTVQLGDLVVSAVMNSTTTCLEDMDAQTVKGRDSMRLNPIWVAWLMNFPMTWFKDGGKLSQTSAELPMKQKTGQTCSKG